MELKGKGVTVTFLPRTWTGSSRHEQDVIQTHDQDSMVKSIYSFTIIRRETAQVGATY